MSARTCTRLVLTLATAVIVSAGSRAQQPVTLATLLTTAESSGYKSTSTYDDVVKFMKAVADAAPSLIHYTTYGTTYEGRPMPLAVVGTDLKSASPGAVRATGKLRVHIQANIHAGEVEGKEASLVLLRELAMGQHKDWLRSSVLLITPIFNADGNEKFSLTNRGRQNGPINGEGTRENGQKLNINRDFMKLETPEARAFATLWNDYDPHVGFDLHTSDGSAHGYYLTYAPPLNPDTDPAIMKIMTDEWFPFVTKNIKDKHGWDTFYYGNVSTGARGGGRGRGGAPGGQAGAAGDRGAAAGAAGGAGTGATSGQRAATTPPTPEVVGAPPTAGQPRIWATFEHVPRFHNNYVGMRNRFALLSEAFAYATFEDRIKATNYFVEEAMNFATANADRLKKACEAADKTSIVGTTEGTRAQMKRGGLIDVLMGEVENETNPVNGAIMSRRKDVVHPEKMVDMLWFEPTTTAVVPAAYYVPAAATKALELLKLHGIVMKQITQPVKGVETFTISSNTTRPVQNGSIDFGTHALRTLDGTWQSAPDVVVPAGAWMVSMTQPLARLAFYLLEPTSDDGVTTWNVLDDQLKDATVYPIWRKR